MGRETKTGGVGRWSSTRARELLGHTLRNIADVDRGAHASAVATETWIRRFLRDQSGAAGLEFGLIIVGISIAILTTVYAIGSEMRDYFEFVDSKICGRFGS